MNQDILIAIKNNDVEKLNSFEKKHFDDFFSGDQNDIIILAIFEKQPLDIIQFLLEKDFKNLTKFLFKLIMDASRFDHVDIVKIMLNKNNFSQILIKNQEKLSDTFKFSVGKSSAEMVSLFLNLKELKPEIDNNMAMFIAYSHGNIEAVELLWKTPSVRNTLEKSENDIYNVLMKKEIADKAKRF